MFQTRSTNRNFLASAFTLFELVYHGVVRSVRKSHGNALMSILTNMMQAIIFVLAFYIMFDLLGLRRTAIRGDFLLYIMSGVFLYMTHAKTLGAVAGAEGPSSPMMQHAPMNTIVAILSAAFGALYIQVYRCLRFCLSITPSCLSRLNSPLQRLGCCLLRGLPGWRWGWFFWRSSHGTPARWGCCRRCISGQT